VEQPPSGFSTADGVKGADGIKTAVRVWVTLKIVLVPSSIFHVPFCKGFRGRSFRTL
jgi:hypothetical protein